MRRKMRDDDICHDANRHRVEERCGTAHAEPGELPEHAEDNPHRLLIPLSIAPRHTVLPDRGRLTKLIFPGLWQPLAGPSPRPLLPGAWPIAVK